MWMVLDYRKVLEVTGKDRLSFLQGLITQDIRKLTPETPLYSLFLTNTGRFFCDFFLVAQGDSVFLTPGVNCFESFQKKLLLYKLRSDVQISVKDDWVVAVNLEKNFPLPKGGIIFQDPRLLKLGSLFLGLLENVGEMDPIRDVYDSYRLDLGVPEGPLDLEIGKSVPLESWMDELNAISWEKGCFLGQELTSRTKHVGEIRKKMIPFSASDALNRGDLLFHPNGHAIGKIISTYQEGKKGFCLLHIKELPQDRKVFSEEKLISVILNKPMFPEAQK